MLMYFYLKCPDEGLIVLSRKRLICFVFNKNVESDKVAAYCFNLEKQKKNYNLKGRSVFAGSHL